MNPDTSHALVNDFMVKTVETNCIVESASLSSPVNNWPKNDLSSAACSHRITPITIASWNRGNLTILRIGAEISLIIGWVLPIGSQQSTIRVVAPHTTTFVWTRFPDSCLSAVQKTAILI